MSRYYRYPKYVSVAERRAKAAKKASKKKSAGEEVYPVEISGRKIAKSFWGQSWCDRMESFGDYANRLPRGRTYARNGSIWHLEMSKGSVLAHVYGSSSYDIEISIKTLSEKKWVALKEKCSGQIGSLIELLSGSFSESVMEHVIDPREGMLPSTSEIKYRCSCPDWASMCKHVAAVFYGIGARLDDKPELLFQLRGVDHLELMNQDVVEHVMKGEPQQRSRRRSSVNVENVFGLDLEEDPSEAPKKKAKAKAKSSKAKVEKASKSRVTTAKKARPAKAKSTLTATKKEVKSEKKRSPVFNSTGRQIMRLRKALELTQQELADHIGVSLPSVSKWEKTKGKLSLRASSTEKLQKWWNAEASILR